MKTTKHVSKFTPDTITVFLNSLRKGNFRQTACKEANISQPLLYKWLKDPRPEFKEFQKQIIEVEAQVESMAVNKILQAGDKDAKWYAWWLERKCPHWNGAVHRWELQVLQRQVKQLKGIIDELQATAPPSQSIDTGCLNIEKNPYEDYTSSK